MKRALGLVLVLALAAEARAAGPPTVAVMPFKDLSGAPGNIGEAIRETVTSDLRDVPGLRVIERGNIDKILAEQNLQSKKADLDALSTVKVGKLLGATLIVAGAYQKAASAVRLTARFVDVETGEIKGTAKVDGDSTELLTLQDRVTVELLKSAGIAQAHVQKFAKRTRQKIKSLKTVELYGDAVVETDDARKASMLKETLNEDPGFVYASRDLDALEKRMRAYAEQSRNVSAQKIAVRLKEAHEKLKSEKDPAAIRALYHELFDALEQAHRWRTLLDEARAILDHPPPDATVPGKPPLEEIALYYVVRCEAMLKQRDSLLLDGESFLKKFPTSVFFAVVQSQMNMTIEYKRKAADGRAKADAEYAKLASVNRWDLCWVGQIYNTNVQYAEAQRLYRACAATGARAKWQAYIQLVQIDIELADWASARRDLKLLGEVGGMDHYAQYRDAMEMMIPADG